MKLDIPKGCREGELQGGYSSTILNSVQALARRAHTMEGMRKGRNVIIERGTKPRAQAQGDSISVFIQGYQILC